MDTTILPLREQLKIKAYIPLKDCIATERIKRITEGCLAIGIPTLLRTLKAIPCLPRLSCYWLDLNTTVNILLSK